MALITEDLEIPDVAVLFPKTRRWPSWRRRPCGTPAAARRHYRHGEKPCIQCSEAEQIRHRAYKEAVRLNGGKNLGGRWPAGVARKGAVA